MGWGGAGKADVAEGELRPEQRSPDIDKLALTVHGRDWIDWIPRERAFLRFLYESFCIVATVSFVDTTDLILGPIDSHPKR